jgi:hypothetical protein
VAANNLIESSGVGSWQLAEDGGIERKAGSPAVKRRLMCAVVQ